MRYEPTFESQADIWDLHKVGELQDFLPADHIEQIGRVTGWIRVGEDRFEIDTIANRDHSLGPCDNKDLLNHQWHQGYFDNGIRFLLFDAITRSNGQVVFSKRRCTRATRYRGEIMTRLRG